MVASETIVSRLGVSMNEHKKPTVTIEELAISNMFQLEAMIRVLEKKGIFTKQEVLEELQLLK